VSFALHFSDYVKIFVILLICIWLRAHKHTHIRTYVCIQQSYNYKHTCTEKKSGDALCDVAFFCFWRSKFAAFESSPLLLLLSPPLLLFVFVFPLFFFCRLYARVCVCVCFGKAVCSLRSSKKHWWWLTNQRRRRQRCHSWASIWFGASSLARARSPLPLPLPRPPPAHLLFRNWPLLRWNNFLSGNNNGGTSNNKESRAPRQSRRRCSYSPLPHTLTHTRTHDAVHA